MQTTILDRLCLTLIVSSWLAISEVLAGPGIPADGLLDFAVTRNGERIGQQVYRFTRAGEETRVAIETYIDYRFMFLPLYRFKHESLEIWQDDRLASLVSTTNDNGEQLRLEVRSRDNRLLMFRPDGVEKIDRDTVPASLWNAAVLDRGRLFGTVRGDVMQTEAVLLGEEILTVEGQPITTRHYRLSGEYRRDLWYDKESGVLVRVRFQAKDGSVVEYVREE